MFADAPFRDGDEPGGGQFDQLGPDHGAGGLLRRRRRWRWARRSGPSASPCRPAISAMSMPRMSRAAWACRSRQLIIGTNRNDILARFINDGRMTHRRRSSRASARAWTSRCRAISSGCYSSCAGRDGARGGRRLAARSAPPARCRSTPGAVAGGAHPLHGAPRRRRRRSAPTIAHYLAHDGRAARPAQRGGGGRGARGPARPSASPMVALATAPTRRNFPRRWSSAVGFRPHCRRPGSTGSWRGAERIAALSKELGRGRALRARPGAARRRRWQTHDCAALATRRTACACSPTG